MSPDGDVLGYEIIYNWQFLFSSPGGDVMSQILVISEQPEETPGVEVPEFSSPNGDVLSYAILYNWQFLFSSPDGDAMFRPKVAKQYLLPTPYPHYNKKILPMQGNPFDRTEISGAKGRGVRLAKARKCRKASPAWLLHFKTGKDAVLAKRLPDDMFGQKGSSCYCLPSEAYAILESQKFIQPGAGKGRSLGRKRFAAFLSIVLGVSGRCLAHNVLESVPIDDKAYRLQHF